MQRSYTIRCGQVKPKNAPIRDLYLSAESGGNVHLTTPRQFGQLFLMNIPAVLLDLLDVASYVYVADQAFQRDPELFGSGWRRHFHFHIPLREPERWQKSDILDELTQLLHFLTDDVVEFTFSQSQYGQTAPNYFTFEETPFDGIVDEVVLFSGGLDSLAGAIHESVNLNNQVLLVHHRCATKLVPRHNQLFTELQESVQGSKPIHLPCWISKHQDLNREATQRVRSFLFGSLAAVLSRLLHKHRIRFYENGVVSLNLPPAAQVVGARATRTTHPQTLERMTRLFSQLFGEPFCVENPFWNRTKVEVVQVIQQAGLANLIPWTSSCASVWQRTIEHPHCGRCSQCVDRRFALIRSGLSDLEPDQHYEIPLWLGPRHQAEELAMPAVFLQLPERFRQLTDYQALQSFGELTRALTQPDQDEYQLSQMVQMYQRHAVDVLTVVDQAIAQHASQIREGTLPEHSFLSLAVDRTIERPVEAADPTPKNRFRRKGQVWEVSFESRETWLLLPCRGADYLHQLLQRPGQTITAAQLYLLGTKASSPMQQDNLGEPCDAQAIVAYETRAKELAEEVSLARANGQDQTHLMAELERLKQSIQEYRAQSRRGKHGSQTVEKLRKSISKALTSVLQTISLEDAKLYTHLDGGTLNFGRSFSYQPLQPMNWLTER